MQLREIYNSISTAYKKDLTNILKESTGIKLLPDNRIALQLFWYSDVEEITEELLDTGVVIRDYFLFWHREDLHGEGFLWVVEDIASKEEYNERLKLFENQNDIDKMIRVDNNGVEIIRPCVLSVNSL